MKNDYFKNYLKSKTAFLITVFKELLSEPYKNQFPVFQRKNIIYFQNIP